MELPVEAPPSSKKETYNNALFFARMCVLLELACLLAIPVLEMVRMNQEIGEINWIVIGKFFAAAMGFGVVQVMNATYMMLRVLEFFMLRPLLQVYEKHGVAVFGNISGADEKKKMEYVDFAVKEPGSDPRSAVFRKLLPVLATRAESSCCSWCSSGNKTDVGKVHVLYLPGNPKSAILHLSEVLHYSNLRGSAWSTIKRLVGRLRFAISTTLFVLLNLYYWVQCRDFVADYIIFPSMALSLMSGILYAYSQIGFEMWDMLNGKAELVGVTIEEGNNVEEGKAVEEGKDENSELSGVKIEEGNNVEEGNDVEGGNAFEEGNDDNV